MLEIKKHSRGVYTILHTESNVHLLYFDFGLLLTKQVSEQGEQKIVNEIAKIVEREMKGSEYDNQ